MGGQKPRRPLAPYQTPGCLPFPQEILDLIIDHLHDEPATLKTSCLVSKAWVQRARKHLFAHIVLDSPDWSVPGGREHFPTQRALPPTTYGLYQSVIPSASLLKFSTRFSPFPISFI